MPYDYYTLLRVVSAVLFVVASISEFRAGTQGRAIVLVAFAVALNPVLPVHLSRPTWAIVDLTAAWLLLAWDRRMRRLAPMENAHPHPSGSQIGSQTGRHRGTFQCKRVQADRVKPA
jgi:hypothetical protein